MEEKKLNEILEELKHAFPKYDILSLPTNQRGNRQLIIVQGFDSFGSIDTWSVDVVYPIWWDMMKILEKYEGAMRDLRLMFIRGNQFLLHSPDVGLGNVFKNMDKPLHREVYGYEGHRHYIGECRDINDVLEYLASTQVWF